MDAKPRAGIIPPRATRRPLTSTHHGIVRVDDYAWLRASNWQAVMRNPAVLDPDIRAQLEAENAYTSGIMAHTEELQQLLFSEMKARIKEDDASVPAPDGGFSYYTRFVTGGQHPLFCRVPRAGGEEQLLIDGNALAKDHPYFRIANVSHSPDHKLIAYAVDIKGSEFYTLQIIETGTGTLLDTRIADTNASFEWASDSRTLLYVWVDDEHRPRKVLSHAIGTEGQDALIHEQPDPGYFLGLGLTQSRRFLLLSVHDHETAEVSLIDTEDPFSPPRLVSPRSRSMTIRSSITATASSFSPIPMVPRITASSKPRWRTQVASIGARSNLIGLAGLSLRLLPLRIIWYGSSVKTGCPALLFGAFPMGASTRSPSLKRPMRSAYRQATNTTPPRSASLTRP